jgi:hypothetical protein
MAGMLGQNSGLVVLWIKRNTQKHQVSLHANRKALPDNAELIREPKTKIGERPLSLVPRGPREL